MRASSYGHRRFVRPIVLVPALAMLLVAASLFVQNRYGITWWHFVAYAAGILVVPGAARLRTHFVASKRRQATQISDDSRSIDNTADDTEEIPLPITSTEPPDDLFSDPAFANMSAEEVRQSYMTFTSMLTYVLKHNPAIQALIREELGERSENAESLDSTAQLPPDTTVYWSECPKLKYFLKRLLRPLVALVIGIALLLWVVPATPQPWQPWVGLVIVCITGWYIGRRVKKWRGLLIQVVGRVVKIVEPKSVLWQLHGKTHEVSILDCTNFITWQTKFERNFRIRSGCMSIDTSISNEGKRDIFRDLTDVRRHEELKALLSRRRDELLFQMGGRRRAM